MPMLSGAEVADIITAVAAKNSTSQEIDRALKRAGIRFTGQELAAGMAELERRLGER